MSTVFFSEKSHRNSARNSLVLLTQTSHLLAFCGTTGATIYDWWALLPLQTLLYCADYFLLSCFSSCLLWLLFLRLSCWLLSSPLTSWCSSGFHPCSSSPSDMLSLHVFKHNLSWKIRSWCLQFWHLPWAPDFSIRLLAWLHHVD